MEHRMSSTSKSSPARNPLTGGLQSAPKLDLSSLVGEGKGLPNSISRAARPSIQQQQNTAPRYSSPRLPPVADGTPDQRSSSSANSRHDLAALLAPHSRNSPGGANVFAKATSSGRQQPVHFTISKDRTAEGSSESRIATLCRELNSLSKPSEQEEDPDTPQSTRPVQPLPDFDLDLNPLHRAIAQGCDPSKIDLLLKDAENADANMIEARDLYHRTPLMLAASLGHYQLVETLLHHGADVWADGGTGTGLGLASDYASRENGEGHRKAREILERWEGYSQQ